MPPRRKSNNNSNALYVTWNEKTKKQVFASLKDNIEEYTSIGSEARGSFTDWSNLTDGISGRPSFQRDHYYAFRQEEGTPTKTKTAMKRAENIYQHVGLIRNIIDLMSDFACQGIRISHPNKRAERFLQRWFRKVNGKDRTERFLNNLYRTGNVVVRIRTGKLPVKMGNDMAKATPEVEIKRPKKPLKREIPWVYTFIDPAVVNVVGDKLASFVNTNEKRYAIQLPADLRRLINSPKTKEEKALVKQLPKDIKAAAKTNSGVLLPEDKTRVYHYRKDDWQTWANPMILAIMDDVTVLEKLKLADMAALDGAISQIRLWKLGSLEHKIAPTKAVVAKLAEVLGANTGVGTIDVIWDAAIELETSNTDVYNFLGEEKYRPHLNNIYAGLGIPPTLTGTFGAAGTTNNFISLKTLTQRLEYGRGVVVQFWLEQINAVIEAMGFTKEATIEFDLVNLGDEIAEKSLLIQLADRNLISQELLQHKFSHDPTMEKIRISREFKDIDKGVIPPKAGPYYDPQTDIALKKMALQTGQVTPGEVGLELEDRKDGEKTLLEINQQVIQDGKKSGQPQQGRPKNAKDSKKRKEKQFTPKVKAALNIWVNTAQQDIADIINPMLLQMYDKKNMRSLSSVQVQEAERLKFDILFSLEPFSEVNDDIVYNAVKSKPQASFYQAYKDWVANASAAVDKDLTFDELKQLQAQLYIHMCGE